MSKPYQAPDRLKYVFEHFGIEPHFTPEQTELLKDGSGFVYLIQCHEFVKIGVAENAEARCAYLQVGNPYELKLLKTSASRNPVADEERLQNRLAHYHERGEWYALPEPVLEALLAIDDLSMLHTARVTWADTEQITVQPFTEDEVDWSPDMRLPPRPKFFRFAVMFSGKCVHAGRVGKTSPAGPIYVRPTRSNAVSVSDREQVETAIKKYQTEVEVNSHKYAIEYGTGAPTTPCTVS